MGVECTFIHKSASGTESKLTSGDTNWVRRGNADGTRRELPEICSCKSESR